MSKQTYRPIGLMLFIALSAGCSTDGDDGLDDGIAAADARPSSPADDAAPDEPDQTCAGECDGCCSGDTCLAGDSAASCGAGGEACVDCGDDFTCEGGGCQVQLDSRWDLTLLGATVSQTDVDGRAWDAFSLPDVYADVYVGSGVGQIHVATSTVLNTFAPAWNQMIAADVPAARFLEELGLVVVDRDGPFAYNTIGGCLAAIDSSWFGADEMLVDCPRVETEQQAGFTLRLRLTRHY